MGYEWSFFLHLGIISTALLLATFIRYKLRFIQNLLIPNAILAGFILLPLYNFVLPRVGLDNTELGTLAYHLLSLSFVALSLKALPRKKPGRGRIFGTTLSILFQFGVQSIIGLMITLIFIKTIRPDLFHSFGYLLPLGFAQGPGQAYSIGESWKAFGVEGAGNIGLTFAAIGFLICSFGGLFIINYGLKHRWIAKEDIKYLHKDHNKKGIFPKGTKLKQGSLLTTQTDAIDTLSINAAIILFGYFLTFLLLKLISWGLSFIGPSGVRLAETFWGLNFIFASLIGLLLRRIMIATNTHHIVDNLSMNRLSGLFVDFMITSAIAAISIVIIKEYWLPIIVISTVAGFATGITTMWYSSRIFSDHRFLRALLVFGVSTGTLSTGLALLRVIDPDFETPVATDYTYASGITFALALPYVLTINLPLHTYASGDYKWFWIAIAINVGYIVFTGIFFFIFAGKRSLKHKSTIWYPESSN